MGTLLVVRLNRAGSCILNVYYRGRTQGGNEHKNISLYQSMSPPPPFWRSCLCLCRNVTCSIKGSQSRAKRLHESGDLRTSGLFQGHTAKVEPESFVRWDKTTGRKLLEQRGEEAVKPQQSARGCISRAARKFLATADSARLLCMLLAALQSDLDHSCCLWWQSESSAPYRLLFQSEPLQSSSGLGEMLKNIFRLSVRGRTLACRGPGLLIPEVMVDKVGQNHVSRSALTGYISAVWCSSRTLWWVTQAADIIWFSKWADVLGTSGQVLLFGSLGRKPITVWCILTYQSSNVKTAGRHGWCMDTNLLGFHLCICSQMSFCDAWSAFSPQMFAERWQRSGQRSHFCIPVLSCFMPSACCWLVLFRLKLDLHKSNAHSQLTG